MGMTAAFVTVTAEELSAMKADPDSVVEVFSRKLESQDASQALDIDKSWGGIHFLLTGEQYGGEPPHSLPIFGGSEFGPELGYGSGRLMEPAQVKEASAVLASLPVDALRARYVPKELNDAGVYPDGIWLDEGDGAFEYLGHWYELLRTFYAQAAERGSALIIAII